MFHSCENGGACVAPNVCNCTPEWTGDYCHIDMFALNFFMCTHVYTFSLCSLQREQRAQSSLQLIRCTLKLSTKIFIHCHIKVVYIIIYTILINFNVDKITVLEGRLFQREMTGGKKEKIY